MQTRCFDFPDLYNRSLSGDQQALSAFQMHFLQKEFSTVELATIRQQLATEAEKTDDVVNSHALVILGWLVKREDPGKAIALFNRAIALGNVDAIYGRGYMHNFGEGGVYNLPAAIEYYERAIELGHAGAMNNRALMHRWAGDPVNQTIIEYYERAILLNHAGAMCNRADMYLDDDGASTNAIRFSSAIALCDRAMALGSSAAMTIRAQMFFRGLGCTPNSRAAIALYKRAVALFDVNAMWLLAQIHKEGLTGFVDNASAARLYRLAYSCGYDRCLGDLKWLCDHKRDDAHIRYHYYMASKPKSVILPGEAKMLFLQSPKHVAQYFLTDDLLTADELFEARKYIGNYYCELAASKLHEGNHGAAYAVLEEVAEIMTGYIPVLLMQADILYSSFHENRIDIEELLPALQNINELHLSILRTELETLTSRPDQSESLKVLMEQIDLVLVSPEQVLSINLALINPLQLNDGEKYLSLYKDRLTAICSYAEALQKYLKDTHKTLNQWATQSRSSCLWPQGLPMHLRLAHNELKASKSVLKTTMDIIHLAVRVHRHLLDDPSPLAQEWAHKLPRFTSVRRGEKRKRMGN